MFHRICLFDIKDLCLARVSTKFCTNQYMKFVRLHRLRSKKKRCPWRWYSGKFFLVVNATMHVSEQKFNVRKFETMRLDDSYRLVTTFLVLNSRCGKNSQYFSNNHRSSGALAFLLLPSRCGSGRFSTTMGIYVRKWINISIPSVLLYPFSI